MLEFLGLELSRRFWNVLEHLRKYKTKQKKTDLRMKEKRIFEPSIFGLGILLPVLYCPDH
jgi:hypothetical protein